MDPPVTFVSSCYDCFTVVVRLHLHVLQKRRSLHGVSMLLLTEPCSIFRNIEIGQINIYGGYYQQEKKNKKVWLKTWKCETR